MPNAIEQGYLDQGYRLPDGWDWSRVAEHRERWGVDRILVPVAVTNGVVGWAVPFVDGRPLAHP